ncbi:MAG: branched-chain amino acid ABC transporter permease [Candidatus Bathyarchaeota archaeon]|nr:MAG: branched-chain amino acid ABC transporter permease [Candidatus Bathyarchaeota archaeon]
MPSITLINTFMYASILILLSVGFSFTHMMEKFPNFAHISYASFGSVFSWSLVRIWGVHPYLALPIATFLSGFIGIAIFMFVVRPMRNAGAGDIHMTFAMFALSYAIETILLIYSFWIMLNFPFRTYGYYLRRFDITLFGLRGISVVAPMLCIALVVLLRLFLTRNRLGIAIRATAEDPRLASSLGVNVSQAHLLTWFMTGALAGLAGAALCLWQSITLEGADELLMNVLASSILGGLDNIYGAIIGGAILAFTQRMMPTIIMDTFGVWTAGYITLTPIIFIVSVQLLMPEGIVGLLTANPGPLEKLRKRLSRPRSNPA